MFSLHKARALIALSAGGLALVLLPNAAWADSSRGLIKATLTIKANCQLLATSQVNFGTVDPLTPATVSGNGSISVACTKGITISSIVLSQGNNFGGTQRRMSDGNGHYIPYQLFTDSSHTTLWGDGTSGTGAPLAGGFTPSTSASSTQSFNVFGLVKASDEDVPPNAYNDTVNVTVNF